MDKEKISLHDQKLSGAGLTNKIEEQESEDALMNLNLNSSQTIKTDKKIDQELRKELNEADI